MLCGAAPRSLLALATSALPTAPPPFDALHSQCSPLPCPKAEPSPRCNTRRLPYVCPPPHQRPYTAGGTPPDAAAPPPRPFACRGPDVLCLPSQLALALAAAPRVFCRPPPTHPSALAPSTRQLNEFCLHCRPSNQPLIPSPYGHTHVLPSPPPSPSPYPAARGGLFTVCLLYTSRRG